MLGVYLVFHATKFLVVVTDFYYFILAGDITVATGGATHGGGTSWAGCGC